MVDRLQKIYGAPTGFLLAFSYFHLLGVFACVFLAAKLHGQAVCAWQALFERSMRDVVQVMRSIFS